METISHNFQNSIPQTPLMLDPLGDGISSVQLVRVSGSDVDIVNAARVSYGKFVTEMTDRDSKLIAFLMAHDHTSPFEHNQLSFRIKCPLFVARQWMRHRMNSYNEISYRYVKSALEFYVPCHWRFQDTQNKQKTVGAFEDPVLKEKYLAALHTSAKTYEYLLEQGVGRELARAVLPLCTYTEFIFTTNLHSLMHFMRLRLHAGAQKEIQDYARALLALALPHFPVTLGEWCKKHADTLEINKDDVMTPEITKHVGDAQ
ncbi:flavin-dependent thymidylate synthase [Candidatus Dependentiae bacterium Noda2021]|nr:flavin-dependent thymidylate synthase [Candidatus Dependentiae bacterium Noda2021]